MESKAAPKPLEKDCIARLLDLTAGWAYFAANEEGQYADPAYAAELYELYQAVGADLSAIADSDETARQAAVINFVGQRLLPVLLGPTAMENGDLQNLVGGTDKADKLQEKAKSV